MRIDAEAIHEAGSVSRENDVAVNGGQQIARLQMCGGAASISDINDVECADLKLACRCRLNPPSGQDFEGGLVDAPEIGDIEGHLMLVGEISEVLPPKSVAICPDCADVFVAGRRGAVPEGRVERGGPDAGRGR